MIKVAAHLCDAVALLLGNHEAETKARRLRLLGEIHGILATTQEWERCGIAANLIATGAPELMALAPDNDRIHLSADQMISLSKEDAEVMTLALAKGLALPRTAHEVERFLKYYWLILRFHDTQATRANLQQLFVQTPSSIPHLLWLIRKKRKSASPELRVFLAETLCEHVRIWPRAGADAARAAAEGSCSFDVAALWFAGVPLPDVEVNGPKVQALLNRLSSNHAKLNMMREYGSLADYMERA